MQHVASQSIGQVVARKWFLLARLPYLRFSSHNPCSQRRRGRPEEALPTTQPSTSAVTLSPVSTRASASNNHGRGLVFTASSGRPRSTPGETTQQNQPVISARDRRYGRRHDSGQSVRSIPAYREDPDDSELVLVKARDPMDHEDLTFGSPPHSSTPRHSFDSGAQLSSDDLHGNHSADITSPGASTVALLLEPPQYAVRGEPGSRFRPRAVSAGEQDRPSEPTTVPLSPVSSTESSSPDQSPTRLDRVSTSPSARQSFDASSRHVSPPHGRPRASSRISAFYARARASASSSSLIPSPGSASRVNLTSPSLSSLIISSPLPETLVHSDYV